MSLEEEDEEKEDLCLSHNGKIMKVETARCQRAPLTDASMISGVKIQKKKNLLPLKWGAIKVKLTQLGYTGNWAAALHHHLDGEFERRRRKFGPIR